MARVSRLCLIVLLGCLGAGRAHGQDVEPLRLTGFLLGGSRSSVTESWGTVYFTVENSGSTPREARVLVFYAGQQDVQFGRDVLVPAKATITAWMPIGPAPVQSRQFGRELQLLLYDRTGGQERLILPSGDERVRSRALAYKKRESTTALFVDPPTNESESITRSESRSAQALLMTHVLRQVAGMPEHVSVVVEGLLPPTQEAFDGTDHVVLAGNRLSVDPAGRATLRRWVEQGGKLWVRLDLVDPEAIAAILGDDADFHVVDRVTLTSVTIRRQKDDAVVAAAREFEKPVELVRVIPGSTDQVLHTVNGWPASFVRPLGRGRVVFTTLGAAAWHRPRGDQDGNSNYEKHPDLPVALTPLEELSTELRSKGGTTSLSAVDLQPLLTEEIGYQIVGRRMAGLILGVFVLGLVTLGIGLRRSRRPELVGWLAPAGAIAAGGLFLILGESSRRSVPPTVAVAEIVDVVPGSGEAAVSGVFAVYQPTSGPVPIATQQGAALDLDAEGLEGQSRRRIQTDQGFWHWENLALPAGVRTGSFRSTARTPGLSATARFGPSGLEGRLRSGTFREPGDAIVSSAGKEFLGVRIASDGSFAAGLEDILPAGQFLSGTVLSDRQQRHQTVYRKLLGAKLPDHMEGRDILLAWAEPAESPFTATEGARTVGTALLLVPLEFERPAAGTQVAVPRAFISVRRVAEGSLRTPTFEAASSAEQQLRFQLPPTAVPLTVERATLFLKVRAPTRRLTVSGLVDGKLVEIFQVTSPAEPIRFAIDDQRFLSVDDRGGLNLVLTIGEPGGSAEDTRWTIEAIGLEVIGKVRDR